MENKQNLFDIIREFEELEFQIESNEGVLTDETAKKLEINGENLKDKLYAYSMVIKHKKSQIDFIKNQKQELEELIKKQTKSINDLEERIINALDVFETDKIIFDNGSYISKKKSTYSTVIENEDLIPDNYFITEKVKKFDKKMIKDAIDSKLEVPGAYLKEKRGINNKTV